MELPPTGLYTLSSVSYTHLDVYKRQALVSLPADLSIDEIDLCLVFSNLLENAIQASVKTEPARKKINVEVYPRHNHLLLIHVENTFDGKIQQKNNIFQSSKHSGNGIGIESVRDVYKRQGLCRCQTVYTEIY